MVDADRIIQAVAELTQPTSSELGSKLGVSASTLRDYISEIDEIQHESGRGYYVTPKVDAELIDTSDSPHMYREEIPDGIINHLQGNGLTFSDFKAQYDLSKKATHNLLDDLEQRGYAIGSSRLKDGTKLWYIEDQREKEYKLGSGNGTYRFGLISDTHLGSAEEHLNELEDFYDRLEDRDIHHVFHAGDISDGWKVYQHHHQQLKDAAVGWERLREYVVEHYPQRDSISTHYITGNHDYKLWKRSGMYFGEQINQRRDDLNWLAPMEATINFHPEVDLELIHPSGGTPYCYDGQTKVLTKEHGFVRFDALVTASARDGLELCTFDTESGELEFETPEKIVAMPWEGDMIRFEGQTLDLRVTPNHRMVVRKNGDYHGTEGEWKIKEAAELQDDYIRQKWDIPKTGEWSGEDPPETVELPGVHFNADDFNAAIDDFLRFLGWFIAEGWVKEPGRIHLSQTGDQSEIINAVESVGLNVHTNGEKVKSTNKALAGWLERHVRCGAKNKRIPVWVKQLPAEKLEILLETLFKGDGHEQGGKELGGFTTASQQLAHDVLECLMKTGRGGTLNERNRHYEFNDYEGDTTVYGISVGESKRSTAPSLCKQPKREPHDGLVYCPKVENGTVVVMRNGKVSISGNTLGYRAQTLYRERDPENRPSIGAIGHLHGRMQANAEGVEAFYTGAWQGPTPYVKRKGLPTNVGGWIVELEIENGEIRKLGTDWINYAVNESSTSVSTEDLTQL